VPLRRIQRSIYEGARDIARALAKTEAFERSRHDRKRVEMLSALRRNEVVRQSFISATSCPRLPRSGRMTSCIAPSFARARMYWMSLAAPGWWHAWLPGRSLRDMSRVSI
jgi:hypothetical protein